MDWIHSYSNLRSHPKTKKLARLLSIPVPQAIGHLHCLWWWACDYVPDGDLTDIEPDVIADGSEWSGDPVLFIDALVKATKERGGAGFLYRSGDRLLIHDFDEYIGRHMERAAKDAARKRKERVHTKDDHASSAACPADVQRTSSGRPVDGVQTAHVDKKEERREEKREEKRDMSPAFASDAAKKHTQPVDNLALRDDFDKLWSDSGRIGSKARAFDMYRWWRTTGGATHDELYVATIRYRDHCTATGSFAQHLSTFLAKPTKHKSALWPEWASGEDHGTNAASEIGNLSDVLEVGARAFGLIGGGNEAGVDDASGNGRLNAGSSQGGALPRRGIPQSVVEVG